LAASAAVRNAGRTQTSQDEKISVIMPRTHAQCHGFDEVERFNALNAAISHDISRVARAYTMLKDHVPRLRATQNLLSQSPKTGKLARHSILFLPL
jgi:hypothetical protein